MGIVNNSYPAGLFLGNSFTRLGVLKNSTSIQAHSGPDVLDASSMPEGYRITQAAFFPIKEGGMSARVAIEPTHSVLLVANGVLGAALTVVSSQSFNGSMGRYLSSTMTGSVVTVAPLAGLGVLTAALTIGAQPSAFDIAQAVWAQNLTGFNTAQTSGKILKDVTGGGLTAADIADAVWDEAAADHTTAGSVGEMISKKLLKFATWLGLK